VINWGGIGNLLGVGHDANKDAIGTLKTSLEEGPAVLPTKAYLDDFNFCSSYDGKHILVTGCTGNIG
jgi:hypothetical protein